MRKAPDSAKQELRRQETQTRRGAPGKRFIGGTAAQSANARRAELRKVERMAKADAEARRTAEPVVVAVVALVEDAFQLARSLALAPFQIARAFLRPAEA